MAIDLIPPCSHSTTVTLQSLPKLRSCHQLQQWWGGRGPLRWLPCLPSSILPTQLPWPLCGQVWPRPPWWHGGDEVSWHTTLLPQHGPRGERRRVGSASEGQIAQHRTLFIRISCRIGLREIRKVPAICIFMGVGLWRRLENETVPIFIQWLFCLFVRLHVANEIKSKFKEGTLQTKKIK